MNLVRSSRHGNTRINLIHIIPNMNIRCALCPTPLAVRLRFSFEHRFPPVPRSRVEKISPRAASRPAPALIFTLPGLGLHKETKV
jgi:hypothetical protein